jgi:class 3 adenylate cyclase/tetratricopeptide (TPR) repeat protein
MGTTRFPEAKRVQCLKCGFKNPAGAKFCTECGSKFELSCAACGKLNTLDSKFCSECGQRLKKLNPELSVIAPDPGAPPPSPPASALTAPPVLGHERKYVTALFTDLSGYTTLSEKLDPEEVKELMARIFGQISKIIARYDGFVEKFVGDAAMVLFGIPEAHEDDPVRAIRTAKEIHEYIKTVSPEIENKIGRHLYMHSGINTGLVVTGEVNCETGALGVLGDTLNTASRLMSLAQADEIIVGLGTYQYCQGYFHFERLNPMAVKGKAEPVQAFLVRCPREEPTKVRRLSGVRAALIGRRAEMELLDDAAARLLEAQGAIISISGEAGTGKSRLIEEFKASLNLLKVQWREGHAYQYAQKIPYFPLINLLSRVWQIQEGDSPASIREKIESTRADVLKDREDLVPYLGSLYSLSYPELQGVNPETWKARLHEAVLHVLLSDSKMAPTVICLEDLQWADPSSVDLLRLVLSQFRGQALFLLAYRPPFAPFTALQMTGARKSYREINLQDLSHTESQEMVQSLLKTQGIPSQLKAFMQELAEGNPFYLEEMINALIEAEILLREDDTWLLSRAITKNDIPSSIQEVISARLDRLEKDTKRILEEASVIGRAFLYDVLQRISASKEGLNEHLAILEHLDLIRISAVQPDLEYVFKHALIQEVVYNGLLKKGRRAIHERIGLAMEEIFHHRLSEFYETLAFHFKYGQSDFKAVDYLIKSGEKALERYALDEAHEHFKEAFDLLANKTRRTRQEDELFIDLISKWFLVFYYRGDFSSMMDMLTSSRSLAESLGDGSRLGMFYCCLAFTMFWGQEKLRESYQLLKKALALGEQVGDLRVQGYAATWLAWVCADLGLFDEGIRYGRSAQEISARLPADQYLYFKSLAGLGHNYWQMGEGRKDIEIGQTLQDFGKKYSNVRSIVTGHIVEAAGHFALGDFPLAIKCAKDGIAGAADPFYDQWAKIALSISFVFQTIRFAETQELLEEVLSYSRESGCDYLKTMADLFMGVLLIAKGQMSRGLTTIEEIRAACTKKERVTLLGVIEYILGRIYLQIAERDKPVSFLTIAKNLRFLMLNAPVASRKAEAHLLRAIEHAEKIGARGILGQAYLDLGLLKKRKGKTDEAQKLLTNAISLFESLESEVFLKVAQEALQTLP